MPVLVITEAGLQEIKLALGKKVRTIQSRMIAERAMSSAA